MEEKTMDTNGILRKFFNDIEASPINPEAKPETPKQRAKRQDRNKRKATTITIIQPMVLKSNPKKDLEARRFRVKIKPYRVHRVWPRNISETKYDCQKMKGPHGKKAT